MRFSSVLASATFLQLALCSVLGIDFGTEFTKASLVAPNANFEIVLTPDTARKDASGLVFRTSKTKDDFERVYGSPGVALIPRYSQSALYGLKPLLGAQFDEILVGLFEETHPGLRLVEHPTRHTVAFDVNEHVYPIEEIVAMSLGVVKDRGTELVRNRAVSNTAVARDAAISVPGFWGLKQRQALKDAAALAGIDLIGLVDDGLAVALNYASQPSTASSLSETPQNIVVYDMGAGSTTATLFSLSLSPQESGPAEVVVDTLGFGAQPLLGGHALTTLVRELLVEKFVAENKKVDKVDVRTPRVLNRLWREAERAKTVLSANTEVSVHIEGLYKDYDLATHITRQEFEDLAQSHVEATKQPLLDSLTLFNGTTVGVDDIDAVVLVGGASRTPFVAAELRKVLGDESKLCRSVNADESETMGTTLRGVSLSGVFRSKPMTVIDRIPHSVSVAIDGNEREEIFAAGTKVGTQKEVVLPTGQDTVELALYEDDKVQREWTVPSIGTTKESLSAPGPIQCTGAASVRAVFKLDQDRIVQLKTAEVFCDAKSTSTTTVTSDGKNETKTVDVPTIKTRKLSPRLAGNGAFPLGSSEKKTLQDDLKMLDKAGAEMQKLSELHNRLEGLLYRIRELAPEEPMLEQIAEVVEGGFSGKLDELKTLVGKALEAHTEHSAKQQAASSDSDEEHPEL